MECHFDVRQQCRFDERDSVISTSASEEKSYPYREDFSLRSK